MVLLTGVKSYVLWVLMCHIITFAVVDRIIVGITAQTASLAKWGLNGGHLQQQVKKVSSGTIISEFGMPWLHNKLGKKALVQEVVSRNEPFHAW